MAKPALISLIKPLDATKLNQRGIPLGGPDVTIFYGSLIEYVGPDHDREKFKYLNELYWCKREAFRTATGGLTKPAGLEPEAEADAPAPAPAAREEAPEPPSGPLLQWVELRSSLSPLSRAPIPGGWLVALKGSLTFVPDPKHQWDGGSV